MIFISLDEGYVFDMLSILDLKVSKFTGEKYDFAYKSFEMMKSQIIYQIGYEKYELIYNSKFYRDLLEANQFVFDLVDSVKSEGGLAKLVDDANYQRYICKSNLQNEFFQTQLREVKDLNYKN